jgi:hypothetical protein
MDGVGALPTGHTALVTEQGLYRLDRLAIRVLLRPFLLPFVALFVFRASKRHLAPIARAQERH